MCGRYSESKRLADVKARLGFDRAQMDLIPRFNIAPTQQAPVIVVDNGELVLKPMQWGLIPSWAKEPSIGARLINARAETVREKPAFRASFKRRRCLAVADSLYEWQKLPDSKRKQPMRILLQDEQPFGFAGLWDTWTAPDGSELQTFSIITGEANALVAPIHNRLAIILRPENYRTWLDPQFQEIETLATMLTPYPAEQMKTYPVSTRVNNARLDDAECIAPLTATGSSPDGELFLPFLS